MVWNVVVRFFVVVLVGCGNWSACYCSSDFCARPILTADFFGDILCLLWCLQRFWFLAATPSVLFSLGGGPSYPGGASHKTKRRNPTSALIRPTLTKLAHCDCTVKEGGDSPGCLRGRHCSRRTRQVFEPWWRCGLAPRICYIDICTENTWTISAHLGCWNTSMPTYTNTNTNTFQLTRRQTEANSCSWDLDWDVWYASFRFSQKSC